ncbi:hypothetical protein DEA8626_01792 [Defluviimonas aquaemixtae]|uniref:EF-hand domain-containing protein n=1 Tax=Albidovulum aquaemixtae TaxID=1542388 RepID=A0A2R8B6V1_9RHOB|nr:calcium-binding protein [Defluviimonas aquaemixtae]SPH18260.1 hypothetical protein DEA8626_01792 [Defluviimonas aquaemixtae]
MTRKSLFAIGLVAAAVVAAAAYADPWHGQGAGPGMMNQQGGYGMMGGPGMMGGQGMMGGPGMMGGQFGGSDDMMRMMMRMHGQMMGGGMMGGIGPQGGFMPDGMMGGVGPMMEAFDADGDANVTPEELRAGLEARHAEFDADGDGALSLAEFEALHGALIRDAMVDRFQSLDNDGDGRVTKEEMAVPADRMEAMLELRGRMFGGPADQRPTEPGTNGGQMPMMDNN